MINYHTKLMKLQVIHKSLVDGELAEKSTPMIQDQYSKAIYYLESLIQEIQKLHGQVIPTKYGWQTCAICGREGECFFVLCSEKYQAHYLCGNKMICAECLKK